jgi:hypothetical protein
VAFAWAPEPVAAPSAKTAPSTPKTTSGRTRIPTSFPQFSFFVMKIAGTGTP